jgi:DNA polymerase-3 subunit delta
MKATQANFLTAARRAAGEGRIFFLCGPDEAGAFSAAEKLVAMLPDPGERIELAGAQLKGDPVRLGDEARSSSLFGGTRHLFVRAAGEEAHDALKTYLAVIDAGEAEGACPVLVVATSATDKSRSAKLLADRADCLVAMFYPPDLKDVTAEVRQMAAAAGLKISGDVAERIARSAGLDVRLAQSEVTKLALYLDASSTSPREGSAAALDQIGAVMEEDGLMPLVNSVLSGELPRLQAELRRMDEVGLNPVGVLLAVERRAAQLAELVARMGPRGDPDAFLAAEKSARRIFFRDQRDLTAQLRLWSPAKLDRLVRRLAAAHRALLANSQAAPLLLAQELVETARFARRRG